MYQLQKGLHATLPARRKTEIIIHTPHPPNTCTQDFCSYWSTLWNNLIFKPHVHWNNYIISSCQGTKNEAYEENNRMCWFTHIFYLRSHLQVQSLCKGQGTEKRTNKLSRTCLDWCYIVAPDQMDTVNFTIGTMSITKKQQRVSKMMLQIGSHMFFVKKKEEIYILVEPKKIKRKMTQKDATNI